MISETFQFFDGSKPAFGQEVWDDHQPNQLSKKFSTPKNHTCFKVLSFNDSVWDVEWDLRAWFGHFKLQNSRVAQMLLGNSTMVLSFSQGALWKVFCHHQLIFSVEHMLSSLWQKFHQFCVRESCLLVSFHSNKQVSAVKMCSNWHFTVFFNGTSSGGPFLCEPLKHAQYSESCTIRSTLFCYSVEKVQILQKQIFSIEILQNLLLSTGVFWYARVTNLKKYVTWGVTICYESTLRSHWKVPFVFVGYRRQQRLDCWYHDTLSCYFSNKLTILWTYLQFVLLWVLLLPRHMDVQGCTEENLVSTPSVAMYIHLFLLPF